MVSGQSGSMWDYVWNPWWGCREVSEGCDYCFAKTKFLAESSGKWGVDRILSNEATWDFPFGANLRARARCVAERVMARGGFRTPLSGEKPSRPLVMIGSMCDLFDGEVPASWFVHALDRIRVCSWMDFAILSKRPGMWRQRMQEGLVFLREENLAAASLAKWIETWLGGQSPDNVWLCASMENNQTLTLRAREIFRIPAMVHGLIFEPLLERVDIRPHLFPALRQGLRLWVVVGGETGKAARVMHPEWVRAIRDEAATEAIPFYFSRWGRFCPPEAVASEATFLSTQHFLCADTGRKEILIDSGGLHVGRALLDGREWRERPSVPLDFGGNVFLEK